MTGAEVRQSFLDFFASKGHVIVPSASLVPVGDPTLLLTNAGMNQFKSYFLGLEEPRQTRVTDSQKCMRVSGHLNDLEEVGHSAFHHTFFEMLGNWSFGDYYKREAIHWAWELLTDVWGMDKGRLWCTVFRDDQGDLGTDEEALNFWRAETDIAHDHVLFSGRKDNFWAMGPSGPCGPCSEIHFDRGLEYCDKQSDPSHVCQVNGDCRRYVEIWNLVFIQYDRDAEGKLEALPARHVDTGMGLERVTGLSQGAETNYETDLLRPIVLKTQEMLGHSEAQVQQNLVSYRVIADHSRAVTFLVGDGVIPGNEGRNYVLRMILRRAARFGRKLGFEGPFLGDLAQVVIDLYGAHYADLRRRRKYILSVIGQEEDRFQRALDVGLALLDTVMADLRAKGATCVPGPDAFRLYDTYGFPLDLTRDVAEEQGFSVDEAGFRQALEEQRTRARATQQFVTQADDDLNAYKQLYQDLKADGRLGLDGVENLARDEVEAETTVLALLRDGVRVASAKQGDQVEVVLLATPFYVESGGQVSDSGTLARFEGDEEEPRWEIEVSQMHQPIPGLIVHAGRVVHGRPQAGQSVTAMVDVDRRMDIARNHSATHLLHSELRYILGEHVQQAGSLVAPERLRFDFTHGSMLTQEELDSVERSVNDAILANYPLTTEEKGYQEAVAGGAMALFGEKYGEHVRVVKIGWEEEPFSQELCGGTHVMQTGDIGFFRILSETSVGSGIRRIEAATGRAAQRLVQKRLGVLDAAATHLGSAPDDVDRAVLRLMGELHAKEKEIAELQRNIARAEFEGLVRDVRDVAGVQVLVARVQAGTVETLREMTDWLRERLSSAVVVLGAVVVDKPSFVAAVTPDLVERGIKAGSIVQEVARAVGGGGGGKPTLAQAGGRDVSHMDQALALVPGLVEKAIGG